MGRTGIARIATGHTANTNNNTLHNEAKIMPIEPHTAVYSSNIRHDSTNPDHPLHKLLYNPSPPRIVKKRRQYTSNPFNNTSWHSPKSSILKRPPPDFNKTKDEPPTQTRRLLALLQANKSPFLRSYLLHVDTTSYPYSNCPLGGMADHVSIHFYNCPHLPTVLWSNPAEAAAMLDQWTAALTEVP